MSTYFNSSALHVGASSSFVMLLEESLSHQGSKINVLSVEKRISRISEKLYEASIPASSISSDVTVGRRIFNIVVYFLLVKVFSGLLLVSLNLDLGKRSCDAHVTAESLLLSVAIDVFDTESTCDASSSEVPYSALLY